MQIDTVISKALAANKCYKLKLAHKAHAGVFIRRYKNLHKVSVFLQMNFCIRVLFLSQVIVTYVVFVYFCNQEKNGKYDTFTFAERPLPRNLASLHFIFYHTFYDKKCVFLYALPSLTACSIFLTMLYRALHN